MFKSIAIQGLVKNSSKIYRHLSTLDKSETIDEKLRRNGISYNEQIVLGYTSEQLCNIVSDVSKYKEFVPFCTNSEILTPSNDVLSAEKRFNLKTINRLTSSSTDDLSSRRLGRYLNLEANSKKQLHLPQKFSARLEIGYPPIKESYISNVTFIKPKFVKAISRDTHLFQYLINEWKFQPYLLKELNQDNTRKEACLIDFHVSFKFHSILYATLSEVFMEKVFRKMVGAFTDRAQVLYGKPCTLPIKIKN